MAKMLCRAVLAAIAISYLICVLFLSGIQKEDLDVSLLQKLQRYDGNLGAWTDEKLAKECFNITVKGPRENEGGNPVSTNTEIQNPKQNENTITELETELNTAIQRLKDESRLPVDLNSFGTNTYKSIKSTETNTESQTTIPIQYKAMDNNVEFWQNFMRYYNNGNNTNINPSSTVELIKESIIEQKAIAPDKNETVTKIDPRVSQLEEKESNKSDYSADVELINKIITKYFNNTQSMNVLSNDNKANVTTTEIPETTKVSNNHDLELHLVSNIAAIEKLNENLEILKRKIIEHHHLTNTTIPDEQATIFMNKTVDRIDNPINFNQLQSMPYFRNINSARAFEKQNIPNISVQNYKNISDIFKSNHQSFLQPFLNLRKLFKSRNIWKSDDQADVAYMNKQHKIGLDKSNNNEKTELFNPAPLTLGSGIPQKTAILSDNESIETRYKINQNHHDIDYSQNKSETDQSNRNSGEKIFKPESHIRDFVNKVLVSELFNLKNNINIPRTFEKSTPDEEFTGFPNNGNINDYARRIPDENTKNMLGVTEPIMLAPSTSKDNTHFQNAIEIQSKINKNTNNNQPFNNDAIKLIAENVKEIILRDLRKDLPPPITTTPKPVTNTFFSKNISRTETSTATIISTTLGITIDKTTKTTTNEKKTTSIITRQTSTVSSVSQGTEEPTSFSKMLTENKAIEKFIELFEQLKPTATKLQNYFDVNIKNPQEGVKPPQKISFNSTPGLFNLFSKSPPIRQPLFKTSQREPQKNSPITRLQIKPAILSQMKPPTVLQFGSPTLLPTEPPTQPHVSPPLQPQRAPSKSSQYDTAPVMFGQFGSPQMMNGPIQYPNLGGGVNIMIPIEPIQKSQQPDIPIMIQTNANEIRPLSIPMNKPVPVNVVLVTKGPYLNDDRRERWNIMVNYEKRISYKDKQTNLNNTKANHTLPKQANISIPTVKINDPDIKNTSNYFDPTKDNDKIDHKDRKQDQAIIQSELNFYKTKYNEFINKFKNKTHRDIIEKYLNDPEWNKGLSNTTITNYIHRSIKEPIAKEIMEGIPLFRYETSEINNKEPSIYSKLESGEPIGILTEKDLASELMSEFIKFRVRELHLNKDEEESLSQKLYTNPEIMREIINNKPERDNLFEELIKNKYRLKENFYLNPITTNHNRSVVRNPKNPFYNNHKALQTSLESEFRNYFKNNRELLERNSLMHHSGRNEDRHYYEQNRPPGTMELHTGLFRLKTGDEMRQKLNSDLDLGLKRIGDGKLENHHSWHTNRDHVYVNPYKQFIEKSRLKLKYQDDAVNFRRDPGFWHNNKYRRDPVEAISELTKDYNKFRFISDTDSQKRIRTQPKATDMETKQRNSDNIDANYSDSESMRRSKLKVFHNKLVGNGGGAETHDENSFQRRHQTPLNHNKNHDDSNFKNFLKTQDKVNRMLEKILASKVEGMPSVENI